VDPGLDTLRADERKFKQIMSTCFRTR